MHFSTELCFSSKHKLICSQCILHVNKQKTILYLFLAELEGVYAVFSKHYNIFREVLQESILRVTMEKTAYYQIPIIIVFLQLY